MSENSELCERASGGKRRTTLPGDGRLLSAQGAYEHERAWPGVLALDHPGRLVRRVGGPGKGDATLAWPLKWPATTWFVNRIIPYQL